MFRPGTWEIDDNLTIGNNFTALVLGGCVFQVASGKTLTFSGPVIRHAQTWTSGSGTVTESGTRFMSGAFNFTSAVLQGATPLVFEGATANDFETSLAVVDPTADRTITLPDNTGTVALANADQTITGHWTFDDKAIKVQDGDGTVLHQFGDTV